MITPRLISIARAASAAPAAPAGGGPFTGCRGCGHLLSAFTFFTAMSCAAAAAAASEATHQQLSVPSGQPVYLAEVLQDETPGALWLRFRFIAPDIAQGAGQADVDQTAGDMDHLCQSVALPYLQNHQIAAARIAISLSDRPVPFGEADPEATQYFELYSTQDATCIWEAF